MKHSICITYLKDVDDCCRHWNYILKHFAQEEVYVMGSQPWEANIMKEAKHIISLDELPADQKVVVMTPQTGKYVQGEVSLHDYKHEDNTIYVFGPDIANLTEDQMGSREVTKVYIPADRSEFYSWVAAAITFYDIGVKNGRTST